MLRWWLKKFSDAGLTDVYYFDHVGFPTWVHVGQRQVTDDDEMRNAYLRATTSDQLEKQSIDLIEHLRSRIKELETECRRLEQSAYG